VARDAELLIADGHHRYETARVYAEEVGGEGPHRYVLMCLVALEDPGLDRVPHPSARPRPQPDQRKALAEAIERDFDAEPLDDTGALEPSGDGRRGPHRLHRLALRAPVHAHAEGSGDRRRGAPRSRRAVPAARHRGARGV
jgi:hypothetical protein